MQGMGRNLYLQYLGVESSFPQVACLKGHLTQEQSSDSRNPQGYDNRMKLQR